MFDFRRASTVLQTAAKYIHSVALVPRWSRDCGLVLFSACRLGQPQSRTTSHVPAAIRKLAGTKPLQTIWVEGEKDKGAWIRLTSAYCVVREAYEDAAQQQRVRSQDSTLAQMRSQILPIGRTSMGSTSDDMAAQRGEVAL